MPEYVFDTIDTNTGVQNIKYKAVRGSDGEVADLNAWKQYRWNIMAYTRDSRVGSPVCADAQGNIFMSVTGSHSQISGWSYVRGFGERTPANTNAFCEKDKVSGCYLHYRTEASIKEQSADPGILPGGDEDNQDARPAVGYIDDIVIETAPNEIEAKAKVLNHRGKFYLLDYNLSPDTGVFTFLGYSLTDDPEDAVTDIRVATYIGQSADSVRYGDIIYARIQTIGYAADAADSQTSPQCDAVYFTKDKNAGSPIVADGLRALTNYADAEPGWEPVSFFGNDIPYNFNTKLENIANVYSAYLEGVDNSHTLSCYRTSEDHALNRSRCVYLYYEPETKYTEYTGGTKYLSGVYFIGGYDLKDVTWLTGEILADFNELTEKMRALPGAEYIDVNLSQALAKESHLSLCNIQSYLCYNYTRNPKRALYNISAYQGDGFSNTVPYVMSKAAADGSENYVACTYFGQQPVGGGDYIARYTDPANTFMRSDGMILVKSEMQDDISGGYTTTLPDNVSFGYKKTHFLPTGLYVTGYKENAQPITLENIVITTMDLDCIENDGRLSVFFDESDPGYARKLNEGNAPARTLAGTAPEGAFHSVYELKDPNSEKPFNLCYPDFYHSDGELRARGGSLCIYLSGAKNTKGRYISSLSIGAFSREQYKAKNPGVRDEQLAAVDAAVDFQALSLASSGCVDEVVMTNIALKNPNNAWYNRQQGGIGSKTPPENEPAAYIGVTRTDDVKKAITGIMLYRLDDGVSPMTVRIGGVEYTCAGTQIPITMNGSSYYLYYTHNAGALPGAGVEEIVIDEMPFLSKHATNLCGDPEHSELYGQPGQTAFIHMKYEHKYGFFNKLYLAQGINKRDAMCNLLSQGCPECIDQDLNEGIVGRSVYMGFRESGVDQDAIDAKAGETARENELKKQMQEAVYDIVITKNEPYHDEGIVVDDIYYRPVSDQDLTAGQGSRLYMYSAHRYFSQRYNEEHGADTIMPDEAFTGYITKIGLSRYDRVPYNSQLVGTQSERGEDIVPWEYVMYSDKSSYAHLNEGAIAFSTSDAYSHHAYDNRVTMFAQRSDGSVKPAGEITGGYVGKTVGVGTGYINN